MAVHELQETIRIYKKPLQKNSNKNLMIIFGRLIDKRIFTMYHSEVNERY